MPLGKIKVPWLGKETTAELNDFGKWVCKDKLLFNHLNTVYPFKGWWTSPAQGAPGRALLLQVASDLEGKIIKD